MFFWNKNKKKFTDPSRSRINPAPKQFRTSVFSGYKALCGPGKRSRPRPQGSGRPGWRQPYTVTKWHKLYLEGGPEALLTQPSSSGTQKIRQSLSAGSNCTGGKIQQQVYAVSVTVSAGRKVFLSVPRRSAGSSTMPAWRT